jgi:pSer/pThr/pTyr-binding forkhead associated (FHA) protein
MTDTRVIIGHAHHGTRGPHITMPPDFEPIKLCVTEQRMHFVVACPVVILGRHTEADLRFAFPDISRRHCRLAFENGQWRVCDLKSLNGIFVNNAPATEATLYAGDILRIGCVRLLVESGTPLRLSKSAEEKREKLQQIVDVLPADY